MIEHNDSENPCTPFAFVLDSEKLNVIEGKSFTIGVTTTGTVVPEEARVNFNGQEYFLQQKANGLFTFTFTNVIEKTSFYLEANGVKSKNYTLEVIQTPTIQSIELELDYPSYTRKKDEKIENTSNLLVPEGTKIKWNVVTSKTDQVDFVEKEKRTRFKQSEKNHFFYERKMKSSIFYQVASSNKALKDYEKLPYNIKTIKDEFPTIIVQSNIDSLDQGPAQFAGQISDDYGVSKLELIYYNQENPDLKKSLTLPINKESIQTFFYQFPDQILLKEGVNYELFFQVYDNDAVNGKKKAVSKKFSYRQKTEEEIIQETLQSQRNTINQLEKTIQNQKNEKKVLDKIQKEIHLSSASPQNC